MYVYAPSTTTLRAVYSTDALTTQLSNPVVADGAGRFPPIYLDNALTYKIVIEDKNGAELYQRDPYIPGEAPDSASLQPYQDAAEAAATAAAASAATAVQAAAGLDPVDYFVVTPQLYGAAADGVTNDLAAINAAIAAVSTAGGGQVLLTAGSKYIANGQITFASNVELAGYGSTVEGSGLVVYMETTVSNVAIRGPTFNGTSNNDADVLFDLRGDGFELIDTTWLKTPTTDGYVGYIRDTASNGKIRNVICNAANGIYLGGHDHEIVGFDITGSAGDDCWVIKAASAPAYNILICNGVARNCASVIAFGSEIGTFGADDPTYSKYARNISVANVIGDRCISLANIKIGGNADNDYRDGMLSDVHFTNCQLVDLLGAMAHYLLLANPSRGAQISGIYFWNCTARYRCADQSVVNAAVYINPVNYPGGTAPTLLDEIYFDGVRVTDTYAGEPNSGAAPGYPVDYGVFIEKNLGSSGTAPVIGRIEFDGFKLNGSRRMAVYVGANVTGPIKFDTPRFKNFANSAPAILDQGAIGALSKVWIKELEASPSAHAPAGTRAVMSDNATDKTVEIIGEKSSPVAFATVAAGSSGAGIIFTAERDTWIRKIEIITTAAVTQNDTNYTTLTVTNRSTNNSIVSANTKTTGGINVAAYAPTSLNGATQFSGADAYLPKGSSLSWASVSSGAGVALTNPSFVVHHVPYSAP
jgi:hypothetical protein